jgi:hypothetical protein
MMRYLAGLLLLAGSARAELPKPELLQLLPRGAECMAQLDVIQLMGWSFRERLFDAVPRVNQRLRELGIYPLDGVRGISGATMRIGPKQFERVLIVEGPLRGRGTALADQRFVVGPAPFTAEVARRAKVNGAARSALADAAASVGPGTVRGACVTSDAFRKNARADFPEVDGADRVLFRVTLGEGLELSGSIVHKSEAAASAMLARLKQTEVKLRTGRVAGVISLRAFVEPLVLEQRGAKVLFRYHMKPQLVDAMLGAFTVMKNLGESSGDPLR